MFRVLRWLVTIWGGVAALVGVGLAFAYLYSTHFARYQNTLPAYGTEMASADRDWSPQTPGLVRILAIDGGALRGIAELEILKALEDVSGKPVHELFDFVAGSSTGAIASALLMTPYTDSGAPRSAQEAINTYKSLAQRVVERPLTHRIKTANGLFGPMFVNDGRIEAAKDVFGETTFGDFLLPTMLPGWVNDSQEVRFFRNWKGENTNLLTASIVSAVTSAETFYPAISLEGYRGDTIVVGDPALVLSSPGHMAYIKAREAQPTATEFVVVTVSSHAFSPVEATVQERGGMYQWIVPFAEVAVAGQSSLAQQALDAHVQYDSQVTVTNFHLAANLDGTSLWDTSADNMDAISKVGQEYAADHQALLQQVVEALEGNATADGG